MSKAIFSLLAASLVVVGYSNSAFSDTRIVSWNVRASMGEGLETRSAEITRLNEELKPDVLVLVEAVGAHELSLIIDALGWDSYWATVSNLAMARDNPYFALEGAVISKIPIESVVEFDSSPDGFHNVFTENGEVPGAVTEEKLVSDGILGFGSPLRGTDRGTMRVDLENGLSIFPLHLKSDRNSACNGLSDARKAMSRFGVNVSPELEDALNDGNASTVKEYLSNALKRERVMAAVAKVAAGALENGRVPVLAGDLNTGFTPGKYGTAVADCDLQAYSCNTKEFPATSCTGGDGYDDTLGMLTAGLVEGLEWKVLSEGVGHTYKSSDFGDYAIDHIVVPTANAVNFTLAKKAGDLYGSDHYPVLTTYEE